MKITLFLKAEITWVNGKPTDESLLAVRNDWMLPKSVSSWLKHTSQTSELGYTPLMWVKIYISLFLSFLLP